MSAAVPRNQNSVPGSRHVWLARPRRWPWPSVPLSKSRYVVAATVNPGASEPVATAEKALDCFEAGRFTSTDAVLPAFTRLTAAPFAWPNLVTSAIAVSLAPTSLSALAACSVPAETGEIAAETLDVLIATFSDSAYGQTESAAVTGTRVPTGTIGVLGAPSTSVAPTQPATTAVTASRLRAVRLTMGPRVGRRRRPRRACRRAGHCGVPEQCGPCRARRKRPGTGRASRNRRRSAAGPGRGLPPAVRRVRPLDRDRWPVARHSRSRRAAY